jgi:uncharacterized membrane protein
VARVLLVGESWMMHTTHVKGFDSFTTSEYAVGCDDWVAVLTGAGHVVDHLPAHKAPDDFPRTAAGFGTWDVVVLSDIGANSLAIPGVVWHGGAAPNPLDALDQWVLAGGGLAMCGGYLSFAGFEAKARFAGTAVERALPVRISRTDDRVENPTEGTPRTVDGAHPVMRGVPKAWPRVSGYNQLVAKPDGDVLVQVGEDPFVVTGRHGQGRSLAFATDIGPHWAPPDFLASEAYRSFWPAAIAWLAAEERT